MSAPAARPRTFVLGRGPAIGIAAVLLAGCTGDGADTSGPVSADASDAPGFGIAVPGPLLASRAVDRSTLRPVVTLSTGQTVLMARIGDTPRWTGTARVPASSSFTASVEWRASVDGRTLPLARATRRVDSSDAGASLRLDAGSYDFDTGLDADGDGVSNLDELNRSSDPFGADLDGTPDAPLDELPDEFPDALPDALPDEFPDALPDEAPDETPDEAPDETPDETPDGVPDALPGDDDDDDDGDDDRGLANDAVIDLFVPRISRSDRPDIDGRGAAVGPDGRFGGEWRAAVQVDASGRTLGVNRLMIDRGADAPDGTPERRWAAMHDGKYLYVLVTVDDGETRFADSVNTWEDDSLEVFIDGDRSRNTTYGDDDDFHVYMGLLASGTRDGANANDVETWREGALSSGEALVLDFATGPGAGGADPWPLGRVRDVYEMRIELASAGIETGRPFGFELQVNDDDDGGARDAKWGWAHPSRDDTDVDFTFLDPSFMGTLLLD